jgi:hypothetical protein
MRPCSSQAGRITAARRPSGDRRQPWKKQAISPAGTRTCTPCETNTHTSRPTTRSRCSCTPRLTLPSSNAGSAGSPIGRCRLSRRRVPGQGSQQLRQRDADLHLQRVRCQVRGATGQGSPRGSTVTAALAKRARRRAGEAALQAPPESTQPVTFQAVAVSHPASNLTIYGGVPGMPRMSPEGATLFNTAAVDRDLRSWRLVVGGTARVACRRPRSLRRRRGRWPVSPTGRGPGPLTVVPGSVAEDLAVVSGPAASSGRSSSSRPVLSSSAGTASESAR